jgi:hypothetical protein
MDASLAILLDVAGWSERAMRIPLRLAPRFDVAFKSPTSFMDLPVVPILPTFAQRRPDG